MNIDRLIKNIEESYFIEKPLYDEFSVKRGLRNNDGSGVLVGLTRIGSVRGYIKDEQEVVPVEGELRYRGIDVADIVKKLQEDKRYGFEEVIYLLLFGNLPTHK